MFSVKTFSAALYLILFLPFVSVLFADFIPTTFGAYADQRLLLTLFKVDPIVKTKPALI